MAPDPSQTPVVDTVDYDSLVIEDNTPVDSYFVEHLYNLLTVTLYVSWAGPGGGRVFLAVANVGLFYDLNLPPLIPDMMLSLDVRLEELDPRHPETNSYYLWRTGKPPDVVVEVVSDRRGGEDSTKMAEYARIGVPYYVIFDPRGCLGAEMLRSYVKNGGGYVQMPDHWYPTVGLGLTLWSGTYQNVSSPCWLRWCDERGVVLPTPEEATALERKRADDERRQKEDERRRADGEKAKRERLEAKLRELGIDPNA